MTANERVLVCLWASEPLNFPGRENFDCDFLGYQTDVRKNNNLK